MKQEKIITLLVLALILISGTLVYMFYPQAVSNTGDDNAILPRNDESVGVTTTPTTKVSDSLKKESNSYLARDGVYVVQYTNSGFVPKQLQIPKGKSVRFINMSTHGLRVFADATSDPKFTELNESKTIGKGGTYTFSFVIEGLWTYHNEDLATDKANIVVY